MAVCFPGLWLIMQLSFILDKCRRGIRWLTMVLMGFAHELSPRFDGGCLNTLFLNMGQGSGLYLDYHCA